MCSEFGNKAARDQQPAGSSLAASLIDRFKATFDRVPNWAWDFHPSIPLIGRRYRPRKSLLIYASAENLSWLNTESTPARFTSEDAWNRYRVQYEAVGRRADTFFPDVGIAPVSDGGLFAAGHFVADRLGLPTASSPRSFLEHIAVSNWCKYSIRRAARNQDYLGDIKKLTASVPFVIGELAVLQPAAVLLPNAVWRRPILAAAMLGASPWTRFFPIPQFNATVVNCHLGRFHAKGQRLRRQFKDEALGAWMGQLSGMREANAWRYLAMLKERVSSERK